MRPLIFTVCILVYSEITAFGPRSKGGSVKQKKPSRSIQYISYWNEMEARITLLLVPSVSMHRILSIALQILRLISR
eukprot:SAG11_NODE_10827_length_803_cov_1.176136_1_plen_76_part_01